MNTPKKSSASLLVELTAANAKVKKLLAASIRSGAGPSDEYKAAYREAKKLWRAWSDACDIEEGRPPSFENFGTGKTE